MMTAIEELRLMLMSTTSFMVLNTLHITNKWYPRQDLVPEPWFDPNNRGRAVVVDGDVINYRTG
jgi:hypothetical protein